MITSASTRARACAIAGLLAGSLTLLAALTYEPSASAGTDGDGVRSATAAEAPLASRSTPGLLPPDRAGDLTEVALAAIPGVLPQHGDLAPGASGRLPSDADLAIRRQQVAGAASRGATVRQAGSPFTVWPAGGAMTGWYGEARRSHRHAGIDLDAGYGAPVVAAGPGTVVAAGRAPASYAGYGVIVIIDHGGGVQTLSAHLSSISVAAGQTVAAGQRIGAVGTTGQVTGPHLHFEVRVGGTPVNPLAWLPAR